MAWAISFLPQLILSCWLCFPFTKNDIHQKIKLFPGLCRPRLVFFACANLFFIIFWVNSCFFVRFLAFRPVFISRCLIVAELTCTREYAKSFCNSKLLFRGFLLLFLKGIASSFGMVLRFLQHLPLCLRKTEPVSACCHIIRDTDIHHTCYGSLCAVTVLGKGKNVFPGCDIGHPDLQKKQFYCYFNTDREERLVHQQDIIHFSNLSNVIVLIFLLLCMTQDAGLQFHKKIKMHFAWKEVKWWRISQRLRKMTWVN